MDKSKGFDWRSAISKHTILIVLIAMVIVLAFLDRNFLTFINIKNIIVLESSRGIMTFGMCIVMISMGIDLSVSSVAALASVVSSSLVQELTYSGRILPGVGPFPAWVALIAGLVVGAIIGAINGWIIGYIKLPPFIATLGMTTIALGIAYTYTNASPVSSLSNDFKALSQTEIGPIPVTAVYIVCLGTLTWVLLKKTKFGKYVYAIGSNENAASVAGVAIKRTKVLIYTYCGILAAFAGILMAGRAGAGNATLAKGYELDAISASAIGGVSMTGGVGTLGGVIVGILLLGVLNNGMLLLGISPYFQQIIKGLIILIAVTFDTRKNSKNN